MTLQLKVDEIRDTSPLFQTLTSEFSQRDEEKKGVATFTYEQFLAVFLRMT